MQTDTIRAIIERVIDVALKAAAIPPRDRRDKYAKEKERAELELYAIIRRVFAKQAKKLEAWVKELPQAEPIKALPKPPVDFDEWDEEDLQDWLDALAKMARQGINVFRQTPGADIIDYALVNKQAADAARKYGYTLIKDINATSAQALQSAISRFVETPGMTFADIMRALPFDDRRAAVIATTEVTRAYSDAAMAAGHELQKKVPDVKVVKIWATENDDLVCTICGPNDGVSVELDEVFPGDPDNPGVDVFGEPLMAPPGHPNCRCAMMTRTRIND